MLGQTKARYNFWAMSFKFQLEESKEKKNEKEGETKTCLKYGSQYC